MSRPYKDLISELKRYSRLVKKQKQLVSSGTLSSRDLNFIYEIAFLSAFTSFEVFIERQFEALACGRPYYRKRPVQRRVIIKSEAIAHDTIKGVNLFPKYLPIENMEKLARIYFRDGKPFTLLSDVNKISLRKSQAVRNYIAHRTRSSRNRFERQVLSGVTLRPSRRNPAGFLRSPLSNNQDRFEQVIADLANIAKVFVE